MLPLRRFFIDMNSFYASVEQQDNPKYRNRPLIVVPCVSDYTCAIAASYEAKELGIKTGTKVSEAKHICPDIFIVEARPKRYVEIHNTIVKILSENFKKIKILSVDEMTCYLDENIDEYDCFFLAEKIKNQFKDELGDYLTCSIGVAPNTFLAKVASDFDKPNGYYCLSFENIEEDMSKLELNDLPGIKKRIATRLSKVGIKSIEDLYGADEIRLKDGWQSILGIKWYHMLRGNLDCDYGEHIYDIPKTIGHSHVLPPAKRNYHGAFEVYQSLIFRALDRLKKYRLSASQLFIYVSWKNYEAKTSGTYQKFTRQTIPSYDFKYWVKQASDLWDKMPIIEAEQGHYSFVAVRFIRTMKNEDLNLQLFDLDFEMPSDFKDNYELPERISFGDPGRIFNE